MSGVPPFEVCSHCGGTEEQCCSRRCYGWVNGQRKFYDESVDPVVASPVISEILPCCKCGTLIGSNACPVCVLAGERDEFAEKVGELVVIRHTLTDERDSLAAKLTQVENALEKPNGIEIEEIVAAIENLMFDRQLLKKITSEQKGRINE